MKKLIFAFGLLVGISIFVSCVDEFDFSTDKLSTNIEQNSDFAIPLVNATFTLDELLPTDTSINRYLIIDKNNFISLQYEYGFAQYPATDFFDVSTGPISGPILPYIRQYISPQIVNIGLNKFLNQGVFYVADPRVTVIIINYWDIPTQFKLKDFYYYKDDISPGLPVTGDLINDSISVNRPSTFGGFDTTKIELNNTNSNIADVISAMPHHLSFGAIFETINKPDVPYNVDPSTVDSVKLKIEIPFDLRVTNLLLSDTSRADLTSNLGSDTSTVSSIQLNMIIKNGFPISIGAQVYFADENYYILDSAMNKPLAIPAASKDGSGLYTIATESLNTVLIENGKMANLLKTKFLISKITFNTANAGEGETVKLYSDYKIGLKVGVRLKLKLKT